jgi:hypothetical protein
MVFLSMTILSVMGWALAHEQANGSEPPRNAFLNMASA